MFFEISKNLFSHRIKNSEILQKAFYWNSRYFVSLKIGIKKFNFIHPLRLQKEHVHVSLTSKNIFFYTFCCSLVARSNSILATILISRNAVLYQKHVMCHMSSFSELSVCQEPTYCRVTALPPLSPTSSVSSAAPTSENVPFHPISYFKTSDDASQFLSNFSRDESVMRWAISSMSPKHRRKLMRQLFEEIERDTTKDGWLSSNNTNCVATQHEKTKADQIFVSLDLNQDGQVSQREFRTWYNLYFKPSFSHEKIAESSVSNSSKRNDTCSSLKKQNTQEMKTPLNKISVGINDDSTAEDICSAYCENAKNLNSLSVAEQIDDDEEKPLTRSQMFLVIFRSSIPYVGFGFMDNCLMILCGELIDKHLGVILHLTTLGAAGYGNMISCATGVVTGGFIERISYRLGLPSPSLTSEQANSKFAKNLHLLGSVIGICIGCLVGMFPLLLLNTSHRDEMKSSSSAINAEELLV